MPQAPSEITRQPVRLFPASNTEVNVERLPDEEALRGMELCYRGETDESNPRRCAVVYLLLIVALSLYAVFCTLSPSIALQIWRKLQAIEGLPIVAAMVLVMLAGAVLLSLVFLPSHIRLALAVASVPVFLSSIGTWYGYASLWRILLLVVSVVGVVSWRRSVLAYHKAWLEADPRIAGASRRLAYEGWTFPSASEVALILHRYLTYGLVTSGAPGLWIAPSTASARVALTAVVAGSASAFLTLCASPSTL